MSTDIKLSKEHLSKKIQSGGFLRNMLGNQGAEVVTDYVVTISLARDNSPGLVSNLATNTINKFEKKKKISGKEAVRGGKRFTFLISSEYMNGIIKIIKSLEDSVVLVDDATETVKHEIKKQEAGFIGALLASLAASLV